MENEEIIEKACKSTDWCAPMVVVPKPNGSVRITTDFYCLNEAVRCPKYEIPLVDNTLTKLGNTKIFSKLNANSGFYQCILKTIIMPFGC